MFGPQIRMETPITTVPGSNQLVVRDEFENLKDQPARHAGAVPLEFRSAVPGRRGAVRGAVRVGYPTRRDGAGGA